MLSATISGARSGSTLFEVDATGTVVKKRTPSMATGSWLKSSYDAAGRAQEEALLKKVREDLDA